MDAGSGAELSAGFDVFGMSCPSRVILQRIGDRWSLFVIAALSTRPMRFSSRTGSVASLPRC